MWHNMAGGFCVSTALAMIASAADMAGAQNYPLKPVRIITAEAGGGNDFAARLIAQMLTPELGQQVIVENRGGAGGVFAAEAVAKAAPDGYTLLLYGSNTWLLPFFRSDVPYDPVRDFLPVILAVRSPNLIVVHPSLPVKSVKELIALAKSHPGQLSDASAGAGSSTHIAAELFKVMANVSILRIPYKGSGPALNDVIAGQVQLIFATAASITPHVRSGRLRALAVTSAEPSALFPALPPVAATVPGYEAVSILGIFAPAKTPDPLIARLNQGVVKVLAKPDVKEKFFSAGVETVGSTPEEFGATVKSEMTRLGKVIRDAGIRAD